ncbi:MAG: phosphoglycerate dehydrogenase [Spirochaetales bacterium]|nr:phosphoglycerate dehydrogenase [Spirochaetales bacterium]
MNNTKILVTARSFGAFDSKAFDLMRQKGFDVLHLKENSKESLRDQVESHISDADGIIAGLENYNRDLLLKGEKLKAISRYGVGYESVDCDAAHDLGIKVAITPGANGDSVADFAVALMLSAARNIPYMDQTLKGTNAIRPAGIELWEKTLGIIGTGRIGLGVAKRLSGFNMRILCHDMYENEELISNYKAEYTSIEKIVKESDFISIHTPLTEVTRNLFNAKAFQKMKRKAVLVNTARGGIINEDDLYDALKRGEIAAAALDVTLEEPYKGKLCELTNCILTPHAGATTLEASNKMSLMAAQNLISILETGHCEYLV